MGLVVALAVVGGVAYFKTAAALAQVKKESAEARRARDEQARLRTVAQTSLVDMYTSLGITTFERGDSPKAALTFAHAATLATDDPRRSLANRVRFEAHRSRAASPIRAFRHRASRSPRLIFHKSCQYLLVSDNAGHTIWNVDLERPLDAAQLATATAVTWSSSGDLLAIGGAEGTVELFRFPSLVTVGATPGDGPITALCFSPDDMRLAIGGRSARIWEWGKPEQAALSLPHPRQIRQGRRIKA